MSRTQLETVEQRLASSQTARNACSIGYWALRLACEQGDLAVVERVLARDPATPWFEGLTAEEVRGSCNTPLYSACAYGHLAVVERLFTRNEDGSAFRGLTEADAQGVCSLLFKFEFARDDGVCAGIAALLVHGAVPSAQSIGALARWSARSAAAGPAVRAVLGRWAGTPELEKAEADLVQIAALAVADMESWAANTAGVQGLAGLRFAD